MQAAIKRKSCNGSEPLQLQDAAIKSALNITENSTCNNLKCSCKTPCKNCKCKMPRLNPLAIIALSRYRDELINMDYTNELSGLVDCCNVILMANQGGRL